MLDAGPGVRGDLVCMVPGRDIGILSTQVTGIVCTVQCIVRREVKSKNIYCSDAILKPMSNPKYTMVVSILNSD